MNLRRYFDRVVVINLRRRPDRLKRLEEVFHKIDWPFKWPEVFEAVDGSTVPIPAYFTQGPGAWGCLRSHQTILERAVADGVRNVLILEDDVCFCDHFPQRVEKFLHSVPRNWDQLMIGGQHMGLTDMPTLVKPGIVRCVNTERLHCYAVRGDYMKRLIERWTGGGMLNGDGHCDWIMGRDPDLQLKHKVYAPEIFLAGQERNRSDINCRVNPRQFWNMPMPDLAVINLHAPKPVVAALRAHGFYTGHDRDRLSDIEHDLIEVFSTNQREPEGLDVRLRNWITRNQWVVASNPQLICTVWHPLAAPDLVKAASWWRVYEITADSVEAALKQLPKKLRRPHIPELAEMDFVSADYDSPPHISQHSQVTIRLPLIPPKPLKRPATYKRTPAHQTRSGLKWAPR